MPHLQRHDAIIPTIIVSDASSKLKAGTYAGGQQVCRIIEGRMVEGKDNRVFDLLPALDG